MDESVTDEGRRQSILKQRNRFPLHEVQGFFPDDDTVTTTLTKSRRVSFGRNLVKEFIVGSAVSTQAVHEYEQSSESLSDPSECSGPLDLALDKTGRDPNPLAEHLSVVPPERAGETKPSDSDQRARVFTENCISIAKSVFQDTETELTAIIIGAKPSSDDERKNSMCMSFTTLDVSGADHWHRGSQPEFGPLRHPDLLLNHDSSYQIDKSRFDFLDNSIGSAALSGGKVARQGTRKPLAPLSQILPWDGENDENIPPAHGGFHAAPPGHGVVTSDTTMEFTCANVRANRQMVASDYSETCSAGGSQSDMEETCYRPLRSCTEKSIDMSSAGLTCDADDHSVGEDGDGDVEDPLRLDATRDDFLADLSGLESHGASVHSPSDTEDSPFGGLQKELANLSVGNQSFRERVQTLPGILSMSTDGSSRMVQRNLSPPPSLAVESPLAQLLSPPKTEVSFLNTSLTCNEIKCDTPRPTAQGDDSMDMTGANVSSWRGTAAVCGAQSNDSMGMTGKNVSWRGTAVVCGAQSNNSMDMTGKNVSWRGTAAVCGAQSNDSMDMTGKYVSWRGTAAVCGEEEMELTEANIAGWQPATDEPDPLAPDDELVPEISVFSPDKTLSEESPCKVSAFLQDLSASQSEILESAPTARESFLSTLKNSVLPPEQAATSESPPKATISLESVSKLPVPSVAPCESDPLTLSVLSAFENSMFSGKQAVIPKPPPTAPISSELSAAVKPAAKVPEPSVAAGEPLSPRGSLLLVENSMFSPNKTFTQESSSKAPVSLEVLTEVQLATEIPERSAATDDPDHLTPRDPLPILENSIGSQESFISAVVSAKVPPRPDGDSEMPGNKMNVVSASTSIENEATSNVGLSEAPAMTYDSPVKSSDSALSPKTAALPAPCGVSSSKKMSTLSNYCGGPASPVPAISANSVCPTPTNQTEGEMELTEANIFSSKCYLVAENIILEEATADKPNPGQTSPLQADAGEPEHHDSLLILAPSDTTTEMRAPCQEPTEPSRCIDALTSFSVQEHTALPISAAMAPPAPTSFNLEALAAPNMTVEVPLPCELPLNTPLAGLAALSKRPSLRDRLLAAPPDSTTASMCLEPSAGIDDALRSMDVTEGTMGGLVPRLMKTMSEEQHMRAIHESTRVTESPLHNINTKAGQQDQTYNIQSRQCEDTTTPKVVNENTFTLNKTNKLGEGTYTLHNSTDVVPATKRTHSDSPCPEERFKKNRHSFSPRPLDMSKFAREILHDMDDTLPSSEELLENVESRREVMEESVGKRIHSDSPLPTDRTLKKYRQSQSPRVIRSLGLAAMEPSAASDISYFGPARYSTDLDTSVTLHDVTLSVTLPDDDSVLREPASFAVVQLSPVRRTASRVELETSRTLVSSALPAFPNSSTIARDLSITIPTLVVPEVEELNCDRCGEVQEIAEAEVSSTTSGDLPNDDQVEEELVENSSCVNSSGSAHAPMQVDYETNATEHLAVDVLHRTKGDNLSPVDASYCEDTSQEVLKGEWSCVQENAVSEPACQSLRKSSPCEELCPAAYTRTATNTSIPPYSFSQQDCLDICDQVCNNVEKELKEQTREDSCLWKLVAFGKCQSEGEGAIEVDLPLLDTGLLVTITYQAEGGSVHVKTVQKRHRPATRYQSALKTLVNNFGYDVLKNCITREEKKMLKLEEVPYFLDFLNVFTRKLVETMKDVLAVLRGCAGSRLSGQVLSFRLHSFTTLFSCWVDLELNDLVVLGQPGIHFRHELGRMDETPLRASLLKTEHPLLQNLVRSAVNHVIKQEAVTGFVTRRPKLGF